jgi:hypothetical protein
MVIIIEASSHFVTTIILNFSFKKCDTVPISLVVYNKHAQLTQSIGCCLFRWLPFSIESEKHRIAHWKKYQIVLLTILVAL